MKDSPYEGGLYHGMLKFPPEYPMKPPSVIMITPSGRFEEKQRICLTISDWHPEQWNPVWKVESIIMGLLSFMLSEEHSVASIHAPDAQRKKLAKQSIDWNMKNKTDKFEALFEKHFVKLGLKEAEPEPPAKAVLGKRQSSKKEEEKKQEEPVKKREAKAEEKKKPAAAGPAKPLVAGKDDNFIYVQCVKVGSKIRLRIVNSTGFNNNWNC